MSKRLVLAALVLCSAGCGPTKEEETVPPEVSEAEYLPPRPRIAEPTPTSSEEPQHDEQQDGLSEQIRITRRGTLGEHLDGEESGPVRLRRIFVFNGTDTSLQNVVIRVSYYTRSGALIDQRTVTLDGTIDSKRQVEYPEVQTGFDDPNAASTRIEAVSANQAH